MNKWEQEIIEKIWLGQAFSDKKHSLTGGWQKREKKKGEEKEFEIIVYALEKIQQTKPEAIMIYDTNRQIMIKKNYAQNNIVKESIAEITNTFTKAKVTEYEEDLNDIIMNILEKITPKIYETKNLKNMTQEQKRFASIGQIQKALEETKKKQKEEHKQMQTKLQKLIFEFEEIEE